MFSRRMRHGAALLSDVIDFKNQISEANGHSANNARNIDREALLFRSPAYKDNCQSSLYELYVAEISQNYFTKSEHWPVNSK